MTMSDPCFTTLRSGRAILRSQIASLPFSDFRQILIESVVQGQNIAALLVICQTKQAASNSMLFLLTTNDLPYLLAEQCSIRTIFFPSRRNAPPRPFRTGNCRAIWSFPRGSPLVQAGSFSSILSPEPSSEVSIDKRDSHYWCHRFLPYGGR